MLRVTIAKTATLEKWTLQGRLDWPWVNQLREDWRKARHALEGRMCIVDLDGVTFVDKIGERMLRIMAEQGADLVASDFRMKQLLQRTVNNRHSGLQSDHVAKSEQRPHFETHVLHE
jgi:anti-anti-sigma regulatory factor